MVESSRKANKNEVLLFGLLLLPLLFKKAAGIHVSKAAVEEEPVITLFCRWIFGYWCLIDFRAKEQLPQRGCLQCESTKRIILLLPAARSGCQSVLPQIIDHDTTTFRWLSENKFEMILKEPQFLLSSATFSWLIMAKVLSVNTFSVPHSCALIHIKTGSCLLFIFRALHYKAAFTKN